MEDDEGEEEVDIEYDGIEGMEQQIEGDEDDEDDDEEQQHLMQE